MLHRLKCYSMLQYINNKSMQQQQTKSKQKQPTKIIQTNEQKKMTRQKLSNNYINNIQSKQITTKTKKKQLQKKQPINSDTPKKTPSNPSKRALLLFRFFSPRQDEFEASTGSDRDSEAAFCGGKGLKAKNRRIFCLKKKTYGKTRKKKEKHRKIW